MDPAHGPQMVTPLFQQQPSQMLCDLNNNDHCDPHPNLAICPAVTEWVLSDPQQWAMSNMDTLPGWWLKMEHD